MHTKNLSLLLALGVVSPTVWGKFIPRDSYMDDVDTDTDDRRSANTFASRGYFSSGVGVTNSTKTSNGSVSSDEIIDYHSLQSLAASAVETSKLLADTYSTAGNSTCTSDNIRVRKEWGSLNDGEKLEYIDAVKCIQSAPPLTPEAVAPGAKTRFDDFVAAHINQTLTIHFTGNFLSWHRYFTWLWEEALRTECGYSGTQPYWDWPLSAMIGLEDSPIFDGSETSLSGNGKFIANRSDIVLGLSLGLPPIYLPTGTGGGCVTSGPFVNMSVNLGPSALDEPGGVSASNPNGPLSYNPRCLKRDLTDYVVQNFANATAVLSNILDYDNIYDFEYAMQGVPGSGSLGIHGGGHYAMGGDPGRDVFVSPGDPAFYLHHGMIDRVWWLWQMQNPQERQYGGTALMGTRTFMNSPESSNTTFEDALEYGYAAGPPIAIKDAMSTVAGPFCYVYE
ncbi:hypothetical protein J7T55_003161 [Diaporthe amygdali]|uniref:uncharacterized protein n=1 Tax=Phomopsis amygdali TaxID=1214568 RepID=UPI0022FDD947|nr:uncharacterized protein J7T55_003161 [Diaporthe amygdali]KAJ0122646.1 hypothetical protein J7T55_003161 [Diaporthe amygdali]